MPYAISPDEEGGVLTVVVTAMPGNVKNTDVFWYPRRAFDPEVAARGWLAGVAGA